MAGKTMSVDDASGVCGALAARTDEAIPAETPVVTAFQRDEILINKQNIRYFNVAISSLCRETMTAPDDDASDDEIKVFWEVPSTDDNEMSEILKGTESDNDEEEDIQCPKLFGREAFQGKHDERRKTMC